jgi:hypothetical protein
MKPRYAVFLAAAMIAACGPDRPSHEQPDDQTNTTSPGTNQAGPTDERELHVDGELADGDFVLPTGAIGDRYELTVDQGDVVEIVLQSSEFDTYLQVITPSGETRVNDDHPGAQNQSRLMLVAREAGRLKITVTSYAPGGRGRYRLDATSREAQPGAVAAAPQDQERPNWTGDLLPNALRIASDLLSSRPHHRVSFG